MNGRRRLGSQYELDELLGRGGMGEVYRARRVDDGTSVAIKVLKSEYAGDRKLVARFIQERDILLGLRHPNLVRVRDLVAEGDDLAIVMDLVEGGDLRETLAAKGGTLPAAVALEIGAQLFDALQLVHDAGVVHRDVKPDNVLVDRDGGYQLTDFGIASLADSTQSVTGAFTGTYAFCAPELLQGKRAAEQSDVYGLGATLYALAAGQAAFVTKEDATPAAVILRIVSQPADPLPAWVPDDLRAVISRAMAKEPTNRYQSARELLEAIEALDRSGDARPGRHPKHVAGLSSSSPQETSLDEASTVTRKVPVPPLDAPTVARSAPTPASSTPTCRACSPPTRAW